MLDGIREFLIGPPLPGYRMTVLSPDALSSIAYANQEIYLGVAVAGAAGLALSLSAATLLIDYVLTAVVSLTSGIAVIVGSCAAQMVAAASAQPD